MLTMPSGRKVLILDALVAAWAVLWIIVGIVAAQTVAELNELSGTFGSVGTIVTEIGGAVGGLELPLVANPLEAAADAIQLTGRQVSAGGDALREKVDRISVGAGFAIALIPTLTLLLLYGPARLERASETGALRALLGQAGGDPGLESFLAGRALERASYQRLTEISSRPWDLDAPATRRALAEEELRRLGLGPHALGRSARDDGH